MRKILSFSIFSAFLAILFWIGWTPIYVSAESNDLNLSISNAKCELLPLSPSPSYEFSFDTHIHAKGGITNYDSAPSLSNCDSCTRTSESDWNCHCKGDISGSEYTGNNTLSISIYNKQGQKAVATSNFTCSNASPSLSPSPSVSDNSEGAPSLRITSGKCGVQDVGPGYTISFDADVHAEGGISNYSITGFPSNDVPECEPISGTAPNVKYHCSKYYPNKESVQGRNYNITATIYDGQNKRASDSEVISCPSGGNNPQTPSTEGSTEGCITGSIPLKVYVPIINYFDPGKVKIFCLHSASRWNKELDEKWRHTISHNGPVKAPYDNYNEFYPLALRVEDFDSYKTNGYDYYVMLRRGTPPNKSDFDEIHSKAVAGSIKGSGKYGDIYYNFNRDVSRVIEVKENYDYGPWYLWIYNICDGTENLRVTFSGPPHTQDTSPSNISGGNENQYISIYNQGNGKGFKNLYNPDNLQPYQDNAVRLHFEISTLNLPDRHNIVSTIPDSFKMFIPPGTVRVMIHPEGFANQDVAMGYHYKAPLENTSFHSLSEINKILRDNPGLQLYRDRPGDRLLDRAQSKDLYGVHSQMPVGIIDTNQYNPPFTVEDSGWLYAHVFSFNGAVGLKDLWVDIDVNANAYRAWYNNVGKPGSDYTWDSNSDPIKVSSAGSPEEPIQSGNVRICDESLDWEHCVDPNYTFWSFPSEKTCSKLFGGTSEDDYDNWCKNKSYGDYACCNNTYHRAGCYSFLPQGTSCGTGKACDGNGHCISQSTSSDTVPPTVTATGSLQNNGNIQVNIRAHDDKDSNPVIYYSATYNGVNPGEPTRKATSSVAIGSNANDTSMKVKYYAIDESGNKSQVYNYTYSKGSSAPYLISRTPPCGNYGDLDQDGKIDNQDASLLANCTKNTTTTTTTTTTTNCQEGDLNQDNEIDAQDVAILEDFLNQRIDTFPVCPSSCPGDFNHDKVIDTLDLGIMCDSDHWGKPGITDLNNNGTTDVYDISQLITDWGKRCD